MNKFDLFVKKIKDHSEKTKDVVLSELNSNDSKAFDSTLDKNELLIKSITKDRINFTIISYKEKICNTNKINISDPDSFEKNSVYKTYLMIDDNNTLIDNILIKRNSDKEENKKYFQFLYDLLNNNDIEFIFYILEQKLDI